jgi:hypothetical protein
VTKGEPPNRKAPQDCPIFLGVCITCRKAKGINPSSQRRFESFYRTYFNHGLDCSEVLIKRGAYAEHCNNVEHTTGKTFVELFRGVFDAIISYVNVVYGLNMQLPFVGLVAESFAPT